MSRTQRLTRLARLAVALGAACYFAPAAAAQQNLFNVPSGDITKPGNLFFQQQFNFAASAGTSNTTFDVGVGRGWEVGFNVLDVSLYNRGGGGDDAPGPSQVNPDLLLNFQKGFEVVPEAWSLGVGAQLGVNPSRFSKRVRFQDFAWAVNRLEVPGRDEFGKYYVGGYHANTAYGGPGDRFGLMLGMEIPLIPERLSFQFDYLSGDRDISTAVVGGVYTFRSGWQLSLGAQLPTPRSRNPYGVVLEFTYPAYPLFSRR